MSNQKRNISPEVESLNRHISDYSQCMSDKAVCHLAKNTKGSLQRAIAKQAAGRGINLSGEWVGFPKAAEIWEVK